MVDKPQVNPQNVRRASGQEVPTLRNVQVPNLRGMGRVAPTAAQAEAQAARQTAAVMEDVGNSIMRTASDIQARADARRKEAAKRQKERDDALEDLITKGHIEDMVLSEYADVNASLAADLERISSESSSPEEVAAKYRARVNGITSEMDPIAAEGIKSMADVRLNEKMEFLTAQQIEQDKAIANSKLDSAYDIAVAEAESSVGMETEAKVAKYDMATQTALKLIDSMSSKNVYEKELLKREFLKKQQKDAVMDIINKSSDPLAVAAEIQTDSSANPELNGLDESVKAEVLNKAYTLFNIKNAITDRARAEQVRNTERQVIDFKSSIYQSDVLGDFDKTAEAIEQIDDMLSNASSINLGEAGFNSLVKMRQTLVSGKEDLEGVRAEEIMKGMITFQNFTMADPASAKEAFLRSKFVDQLKHSQVKEIISGFDKQSNPIFTGDRWKLAVSELELAIPDGMPAEVKSKLFSDFNSGLIDMNEVLNAQAAYGDGEIRRQSVINSVINDVIEDGLSDKEAQELLRTRTAEAVSKMNQSQSSKVRSVASAVPKADDDKQSVNLLGSYKNDADLVEKANIYLTDDGYDVDRMKSDFDSGKITEAEAAKMFFMFERIK